MLKAFALIPIISLIDKEREVKRVVFQFGPSLADGIGTFAVVKLFADRGRPSTVKVWRNSSLRRTIETWRTNIPFDIDDADLNRARGELLDALDLLNQYVGGRI